MRRPAIACTLLLASSATACGGQEAPPAPSPMHELLLSNDREGACRALCAYTLLNCRQEKRAYASEAACLSFCDQHITLGSPGDARGDSVQCRLTYAVLAKETLTFWFCQNASASGGLQCR